MKMVIRLPLLNGEEILMVLFGLFALLFINITAWTYNQNYGMIYYSIFIAHAYSYPYETLTEDDEMEEYEELDEIPIEEA